MDTGPRALQGKPLSEKFTAANRLFPVFVHFPDVLEILSVCRGPDTDEAVRETAFARFVAAIFLPVNADIVLLRKIYQTEQCRGFLTDVLYLFADAVVLCRHTDGAVVSVLNSFSDIITETEMTVYCVLTKNKMERGHINGIVPPPGPGLGIEWVAPAVQKLCQVLCPSQRTRMLAKLAPGVCTLCRAVSLVANKYRSMVLAQADPSRLVFPNRDLPPGSPAPPRKRPSNRQTMRPELLESIRE